MPAYTALVPVRSSLAAWRFLPTAWSRAWPTLIVCAAVFTALLVVRTLPPAFRGLLAGLAAVLASGAVWRAGLPKGADILVSARLELRLLAAAGLTVIFLLVMASLAFIVWLAFAYAAAASGPGFVASDIASWSRAVDARGRGLMAVVSCLCAGALSWCGIRVSLAAPATVHNGRVQVLASWPLTRRRVISILAAAFITLVAPGVLIWGLLFARRASAGSVSLALDAALGLAAAGLWLPLTVGLMNYLYADVEPPERRA